MREDEGHTMDSRPRLVYLLTFFRGNVIGGTGRTIRCAVYHIESDIHVCLEYEDDRDVIRSQVVKEADMERAAKLADGWLRDLKAKGFAELSVDHRLQ
jgi:hypothetical protein